MSLGPPQRSPPDLSSVWDCCDVEQETHRGRALENLQQMTNVSELVEPRHKEKGGSEGKTRSSLVLATSSNIYPTLTSTPPPQPARRAEPGLICARVSPH